MYNIYVYVLYIHTYICVSIEKLKMSPRRHEKSAKYFKCCKAKVPQFTNQNVTESSTGT